MPKIHAIIQNEICNSQLLRNTLSMLAQEKQIGDIHLINNFSVDAASSFAADLASLAADYCCRVAESSFSIYESINQIAVSLPRADLLFLLDSRVELARDTLGIMMQTMTGDAALRGVNPLFLTSWEPDADIVHLGTVTDHLGQLHWLYEGIAADSPLASKRRGFSLANGAAFLTYAVDFQRAEGFRPELAESAFADLCLRMLEHGGYFTTIPEAKAVHGDRFASWKECGLWNSLLWRQRLPLALPAADYHGLAAADGLVVSLSSWLWPQCPALAPGHHAEFFTWRHNPDPKTLLAWLASLDMGDMRTAIDIARRLPISLPRQHAFYERLANQWLAVAREGHLPHIADMAAKWLKGSRIFRHRHLRQGMAALRQSGIYNASLDICPPVYDASLELVPKAEKLEIGSEWPQIAIVMPVYNPQPLFLREAIDSVKTQSYGQWQLCIADDCSSDPDIKPLLQYEAANDARIKLVFRETNGHICHATNTALTLTQAPWAAFMDNDDLLEPEALTQAACCAAQRANLGMIYTDEDHIDSLGCFRSPHYANAWDHAHLPAHLCIYRLDLLHALGGLRPGMEGCQDTDLAIRARERLEPGQFAHIPRILYHWRIHEASTAGSIGAKPYVVENTQKMFLQEAERAGLPGVITRTGHRLAFNVAHYVPDDFHGVIVFPSRRKDLPAELEILTEELVGKVPVDTLFLPVSAEELGNPANFAPHMPWWQNRVRPALEKINPNAILFIHPALRPLPGCRPEQLLIQTALPRWAMAGSMLFNHGLLVNGGLYPDATGLPFPLLRGVPENALALYNWGRFATAHISLGFSWLCFALRPELLANLPSDVPPGAFSAPVMALKLHQQGQNCMVSPFGRWDLGGFAALREPDNVEIEDFLQKWGEEVRTCGLRHPLLKAAPDFDWTLNLEQ